MALRKVSLEEVEKRFTGDKDLIHFAKEEMVFAMPNNPPEAKSTSLALEVSFYACKDTGALK